MKKGKILFIATLSTCVLISTGCNSQPKVGLHKLTLEARNGHFADGSTTLSLTFDTGMVFKDIKGYETPTPISDHFTFDCWKDSEAKEIKLDDKLNYTTDVIFVAYYNTDHTHEYDSYKVNGKNLYGHCKHCGTDIILNDDELKTFDGKFLEKKGDLYSIHDDADFATVVDANNEVDLYIASGTHFYTYRGANSKKVRLHGLNNYDEKMNSTLRCYSINQINVNETYSYVWLENINLEVNNVHMLGVNVGHSYYHGLRCKALDCNDCYFTGFQSIYADTFNFNNCLLDSSMVEATDNKPEYAIWLYGTPSGTFENCNFISSGKTLKAFSEGGDDHYEYHLKHCNFTNLSTTYKEHGAVTVDAQYITRNVGRYDLYLEGCTYQADRFNGLVENQGDYPEVHVHIS